MGFISKFLLGLVILEVLYLTGFFSRKLPPLDSGDGWWAKEEKGDVISGDTSIQKFNITFSKKGQDDLKKRLKNTRYFESLEGTEWSYGTRSDEMKKVVDYWLNKYSWKTQEKVLNQYDHYRTKIEGISIHFVHVKPKVKKGQQVKPLLMAHGWPGSFYEFYKIIPMLTDPTSHGGSEADTFEVVCPSIPGYGFSEAAHRPGFDQRAAARIYHTLMHERLGFEDYYVQGGDWGSNIVETMSLFYPKFVRGHHNNFITYQPPLYPLRLAVGSICPSLVLTKKSDQDKIFPIWNYTRDLLLEETGYFHLQATKPDTIGHALTDSPVGLAAYILEKFTFWTNPANTKKDDGALLERFTMDDLLNNVMIYWISGSITSSMRMYKEFVVNIGFLDNYLLQYPVEVPTGVAVFPYEAVRIPEPWLHYRYKNLVSYSEMPDGGHFAALEQPELLAKDIRQFVRKVENQREKKLKQK